MATANEYAAWIVKNQSKQGSPEFETVARAYELAKQEESAGSRVPEQAKPINQGPSFGEWLKGIGEAALSTVTAPVGLAAGGLNALNAIGGNVAKYATGRSDYQDVGQAFEQPMQALTYAPRTETGQDILQGVADIAAPLPGLGGELSALSRATQLARPIAQTMAQSAKKAAVAPAVEGLGSKLKTTAIASEAPALGAGQAAENLGIRTLTSDYFQPETNAGKLAQRITEKIPLAGTGGQRAAQQSERIGAIKRIASEYGADADTPLDQAIYGSLTQKKSERFQSMQGIKNAIKKQLPQEAPVPVSNTLAAFDKEIDSLRRLSTPGAKAKITALQEWKSAFEKNPNFNGLDSIRAEFGTTIKGSQPGDVRTALEQVSSKIYPAIKEDMQGFIKTNAGDSAARRWAVANETLATGINEINRTRLRAVLNNGQATPEVVNRLLFSQKPSEVQLLMRNLTPEGQAAARTSVLQKAIRDSGGLENTSPDKFLNSLNRMGPQVQYVFQGEAKQELDGLMKALDFTRRAGQAIVNPETGSQNLLPTAVAGTIATFGGPGGLAATAGIGLIGRAYESRAVRNALIRMNSTKPGSKQEAAAFMAAQKAAQMAQGKQ